MKLILDNLNNCSNKKIANDQLKNIDFLLREVNDVMMNDTLCNVLNDWKEDNASVFIKKYEEILANLKSIRGELDSVAESINKK